MEAGLITRLQPAEHSPGACAAGTCQAEPPGPPEGSEPRCLCCTHPHPAFPLPHRLKGSSRHLLSMLISAGLGSGSGRWLPAVYWSLQREAAKAPGHLPITEEIAPTIFRQFSASGSSEVDL